MWRGGVCLLGAPLLVLGCVPTGDEIFAEPAWAEGANAVVFAVDEAGDVVREPRLWNGTAATLIGLSSERERVVARNYGTEDLGIDRCGLSLGGDGPKLPAKFESWSLERTAEGEVSFRLEASPTEADLRYQSCAGRSLCSDLELTEQVLEDYPAYLAFAGGELSQGGHVMFGSNVDIEDSFIAIARLDRPLQIIPKHPDTAGVAGVYAVDGAIWLTDGVNGVYEYPPDTGAWIKRRPTGPGRRFISVDAEGRVYELGPEGPTFEWVGSSTRAVADLPPNLDGLRFGRSGQAAYVVDQTLMVRWSDGEVQEIGPWDEKLLFVFWGGGLAIARAEETQIVFQDGTLRTIEGDLGAQTPRVLESFRGGLLIAGKFGLLQLFADDSWCDLELAATWSVTTAGVGSDGQTALLTSRNLNRTQGAPALHWVR